ncbi:nuclear transport factor 2 family protein [Gordonia insulae]|uniref:nuclear transport factor 2 family protein n=1 Tax=Gordonia insulae TaxID=2420509 RepID=UPI000F5C09F7|nr:nuclear transport factor 2 family protein [Gordonia insulae]
MTVARLKEMFDQMVVRKDADLIGRYYHPDFVMTSDGLTEEFADFADGHRRVYATDIAYAIEYDEDAWVDAGDRVAGRVWITTSRPGETPTRIEVVLIASYLDGRIHRVWETTWPSWRTVDALESYEQ